MEILRRYKDTHLSVSSDGRVFTHKRNHWLKLSIEKGYVRVHPRALGKHNFFVHRMVAECFIPNPDNKPLVRHLDNNPLNNDVNNLAWGTQSENIQQAYDQNRNISKG